MSLSGAQTDESTMAVVPTLAVVRLAAKNGIVRDEVLNDWVFNWDEGLEGDPLVAFVNDLVAFYNTAATGATNAVGSYLNQTRSRASGVNSVKLYDLTGHLNGSRHGPPYAEHMWTLAPAPLLTPLPDEVAFALSFHSAYGVAPEFGPGTRPRARDRGRIYIGPLTIRTLGDAETATGIVRPWPTFATDVGLSAATLLSSTSAHHGNWCVWSRKDAALKQVIDVWTDDAFDTVRGRGPDPTAKSFSVLV